MTNKKRRHLKKIFGLGVVVLLVVVCAAAWVVASKLIEPANRVVGSPPADFPAESVSFESISGATIKAWYRAPEDAHATIILLHPIRGDRRDMLDRGRLLHERGYSTLLVDLQAHGESIGSNITIGYQEKFDVLAAVQFVRAKDSEQKIGIIGRSLGGASALLANPDIDLLVVESVYPTVEEAVHNRINMRLGPLHHILAPMLLVQLKPRLGIAPNELRPIGQLGKISCPTLIASGENDQHTTLEETRRMFEMAREPKKLVVFDGATHEDLFLFDKAKYQKEILSFVDAVLAFE